MVALLFDLVAPRGSVRWLFVWLFIGVEVATYCAPCRADDAGRIDVRITVVEGETRRPIPHAHVRLVGDARTYDGFTDASGALVFSGVVRDTYGVRVDAAGYAFSRDADVAFGASELQVLTVRGIRTKLPRIGSVATALPPIGSAAEQRNETDAAAILSGGVGSAFATLPVLSSSPSGGLLLNGHDGATTAVTLDGAPMFPSGVKNQLGLLGSDVFASANFGSGAIAGAPNGTLDVRTYDPTLDWSGAFQARPSSYGGNATKIQERGTAGRVGLAVVHSQAEVGAPLDGVYFSDTSGLAYPHQANRSSSGDTVTMRYGFDANHVAFLDLGSLEVTNPFICAQLSGPLPCGYGPGNRTSDRMAYAQVRDTLTLDRASIDVHVFQSTTHSRYDLGHELSAGVPIGSDTSSATLRRGYLAKVGLLGSGSRVTTLRVSGYRDVTTSGGLSTTSTFPQPTAASVTAATLELPIIATRRLALSVEGGHDASAGTTHGTFGIRTSYRATSRDGISASFFSGHLGSMLPFFNGVDIPQALTIDCDDGAAIGGGPLLSGTISPTSSARVAAEHRAEHVSFSAAAHWDATTHATVDATVSAGALSPSLLNAEYFKDATRIASANCGHPVPISLSNLYYRVAGRADRVVNDGLDASLRVDVGRAAHFDFAYSLDRVRAFGSGFPFGPGSNLVSGAQVPLKPLHRGSAAVAFAASRNASVLSTVNYYGAGNAYSLRPFTSLDIGLRLASFSSDVTVAIQNAGGVKAGPFARFDPFPALEIPISPRTFSLRYRLSVGKQGIDRTTFLSPPLANGLVYIPRDFEPAPAEGWLSPDKSTPICGAEQLSQAIRYEDAIRAYETRVREALSGDGTPGQVPPSSFDAMELTHIQTPDGYVIQVKLDMSQNRKVAPFARCSRIHSGEYDDVARLHLYTRSWRDRESSGFSWLYSPRVGLYYEPSGANETSRALKPAPFGLPTHEPADAFAIDETCPATYQSAVRESVAALKSYVSAVYAGAHAGIPAGFAIAKHAAKREPWLEIRSDDSSFGVALANCLSAPTVSIADLNRIGLSGANFPSLNYAPSLGFYRAAGAMR